MSEPKFKPGDIVEVVQDTTCHGSPNGTRLTIKAQDKDNKNIYYRVEENSYAHYEHDLKLITEATSMTKRVIIQDEYRIKTESPLERRMVLAALMEAGFVWHYNSDHITNAAIIEREFPQDTFGEVHVHVQKRDIGGNVLREDMIYDSAVDMFKALGQYKAPIEIKLNSNHTATVTSSEVKVGCQTFSFAVIEQLAEAVAKMKEVSNVA